MYSTAKERKITFLHPFFLIYLMSQSSLIKNDLIIFRHRKSADMVMREQGRKVRDRGRLCLWVHHIGKEQGVKQSIIPSHRKARVHKLSGNFELHRLSTSTTSVKFTLSGTCHWHWQNLTLFSVSATWGWIASGAALVQITPLQRPRQKLWHICMKLLEHCHKGVKLHAAKKKVR